MKLLIKNGMVLNVFTDTLDKASVLISDDTIVGVGDYADDCADVVYDATGKVICPGFIDGHIHIESTMLTPAELAKVSLIHGTTSIFADPHEIANVCGSDGIAYMLETSEGLPLHVHIMLPSCVPATPFDESGAVLSAADLKPFYAEERVQGLAEMMNYPGVLFEDPDVLQKIADARSSGYVVDGHAPMLTGADLDKYISFGVASDHETTSADEAKERVTKGQYIMIREGTAAKNLEALLPLFDEPWNRRCLLCTDDRHPADLLADGHIDNIVKKAIGYGKDPLTVIRMATIQAAQYFGVPSVGAVAPGYKADLLVLDDLKSVAISSVFSDGKQVVKDGVLQSFDVPTPSAELDAAARSSFHVSEITSLALDYTGTKTCRVIEVVPGQLLTNELHLPINFDVNNGISVADDILKLAVIERHKGTGHMGIGYIKGIGLQKGAIAASVSHDSHNLIVIGTNDADMIAVANHVRAMNGGSAIVVDGSVVAEMPLPIAGLMCDLSAAEIAEQNSKLRSAVSEIGVNSGIEPFMNMAFVSLPVIPSLKMSTQGLIDVDQFKPVDLII